MASCRSICGFREFRLCKSFPVFRPKLWDLCAQGCKLVLHAPFLPIQSSEEGNQLADILEFLRAGWLLCVSGGAGHKNESRYEGKDTEDRTDGIHFGSSHDLETTCLILG
jgi:hypothetical protein